MIPDTEVWTINYPVNRHYFAQEIEKELIFHLVRHGESIVYDVLFVVDSTFYTQVVLQVFFITLKILSNGSFNDIVKRSGDREVT